MTTAIPESTLRHLNKASGTDAERLRKSKTKTKAISPPPPPPRAVNTYAAPQPVVDAQPQVMYVATRSSSTADRQGLAIGLPIALAVFFMLWAMAHYNVGMFDKDRLDGDAASNIHVSSSTQ